MPQKLILQNWYSPGDIVTLTACIRDLHKAHPGQYLTDVRTPCPDMWMHNPYITPLQDNDPEVQNLMMDYPIIHNTKKSQYHMINGFRMDLENKLGIHIPSTEFKGDIYISEEEKSWKSQIDEITKQSNSKFWIIFAGGKDDFTAKWWDHDRYQEVVDYFKGRIQFVQCGERSVPNYHGLNHHHKPLKNVINLVGATSTRQLIRLMYHADGVVCPVTFGMHLAAATPVKPGKPLRACVVIAGGREENHWEQYPGHQYLHTVGQLPCCHNGGCWKRRILPLGDGSDNDNHICEKPVQLSNGNIIPKCLDMVSTQDVIRSIEKYLEYDKDIILAQPIVTDTSIIKRRPTSLSSQPFHLSKGYGDIVNSLIIWEMHEKRGWKYSVRSSYDSLNWILSDYCDTTPSNSIEAGWIHNVPLNTLNVAKYWLYNEIFINVSMYPLNKIQESEQDLWQEIIDTKPILPEPRQEDINPAKYFLKDLKRPIISFHPKGWSYPGEKSLPTQVINQFADRIIAETGGTIVIFDHYGDLESPHENVVIMPTGEEEWKITFRAMVEVIRQSDLFIGIDSGPLHLARVIGTVPTIGLWMSRHCYPTKWTLPGTNRWNMVPSDFDDWNNLIDQELWGIKVGGTNTIEPEKVAKLAGEILATEKNHE